MKPNFSRGFLVAGVVALTSAPVFAAETFDFYKQGRTSGDLEPNAGSFSCSGGDRCSSNIGASILGGTLSFTQGLITVDATARYYASGYSGAYTAATVVQDHDSGWTSTTGAGLGVYHTLPVDNSDDNITANEMLILDFGQTVNLSALGLRSEGHNFTNWITGSKFEYSTTGTSGSWASLALPKNVGSIATNLTSQTFYFRFGPHAIGDQYYIASMTVAAVPEPETYAMMLAGLGLLGVMTRRRKQKAVA